MLTANMPSKMVFAEEQLVGAIPSGAKEASVPAPEVDYESIYSGAVENVKAEVEQEGADYDWLEYALYDMDQDGYLELLIQNGTCNADMTYEIYTTEVSATILAKKWEWRRLFLQIRRNIAFLHILEDNGLLQFIK